MRSLLGARKTAAPPPPDEDEEILLPEAEGEPITVVTEVLEAPAPVVTPAPEATPEKTPERIELEAAIGHHESLEKRLAANADLLNHALQAEATAKAEATAGREKLADAVLAGNGRAVQREMASVRDAAELATARVEGLQRQKQAIEAEIPDAAARVSVALTAWKISEEKTLAEQYRLICQRFEDELTALLPYANSLNGRLRLALLNVNVPFPGMERSIVSVPRSVYLPPDRAALINAAGRIGKQAEARRRGELTEDVQWREVPA